MAAAATAAATSLPRSDPSAGAGGFPSSTGAASLGGAVRSAGLDEHDDDLIGRAAGGDTDAFGRLVRRHLGRIVAFAGRTLGDAAAAEDVAQETFLRLWTGAARWRPTGARLSTWLHTVALNLCRDRMAKRREAALDDVPDPPDPAPSADARLATQAIGAHVQAALAELPDAQRVAITLCHFQGMRNQEAAEVMNVSVEALESLLARARRGLRARLAAVAHELLGST
jgi:RNA polymerase sigma-70 factor (ECF subfamily)